MTKSFHLDLIFIPVIHDEYYRDKRDSNHCLDQNYPNIRIFNDIVVEGDVAVVPWLVGEEHKKIKKLNAQIHDWTFRITLSHMNAMVQMPDTGELGEGDLQGIEHVFYWTLSQTSNKRQHYIYG